MKKHILLPVALVLFMALSCQKEDLQQVASGTANNTAQNTKNTHDQLGKDHIKIAVLSDIHYMHESLILESGALTGIPFFSDAMPNKALQAYSVPIFEQVVKELINERPDILLIAGDLAKDGELVSHQAVAGILEDLQTQRGIKVYIAPGNNDINNNSAVAYTKDTSYPVPNVTPEDFTGLYGAFGYSNAIKTDPNSWSYVAEPFPGLWILSIDAAHYDPYDRKGSIKQETLTWIQGLMTEANDQNITVLGLMHHNLIEHIKGQNQITRNTVIENSKAALEVLAGAGLKVIFTGHNHAIDITEQTYGGKTIYDIETGSLITPPSSYRVVTLKNKELDIDTRHVTSLEVPLPDNQGFTQYSQAALSARLDVYFNGVLPGPFGVPEDSLWYVTPLVRNAYMAHMAGDEKISPQEQAKINTLQGKQYETIVGVMKSLWSDLGTKDHKWHIKLTNP